MFKSPPPADYDRADPSDKRAGVGPLHPDLSQLFSNGYAAQDPTMARHVEAACQYGAMIERVSRLLGLLPSIIAGFGSRQSGWGTDLQPLGPEGCSDVTPRLHRTEARPGALPADGQGFARGLMQLDYDHHEIARSHQWRDPEANIEAACRLVREHRTYLRKRTTLQGIGLLRAALAAFDCGVETVQHAVRQGLDIDSPTSNRNYGRDILERASFFQAHGWD